MSGIACQRSVMDIDRFMRPCGAQTVSKDHLCEHHAEERELFPKDFANRVSYDEWYHKSRRIVQDAAYIFAVEDLCCTAGGAYDCFMDFLMQETDQRWVLPHYFRSMLEDKGLTEKGFERLGSYLYMLIDESPKKELLGEYTEDIRIELLQTEHAEEVKKIFHAYDSVSEALSRYKEDQVEHGEVFHQLLKDVTNGVKGLKDWPHMF